VSAAKQPMTIQVICQEKIPPALQTRGTTRWLAQVVRLGDDQPPPGLIPPIAIYWPCAEITLERDPRRPTDTQIDEQLRAAGWAKVEGRFLCPQHACTQRDPRPIEAAVAHLRHIVAQHGLDEGRPFPRAPHIPTTNLRIEATRTVLAELDKLRESLAESHAANIRLLRQLDRAADTAATAGAVALRSSRTPTHPQGASESAQEAPNSFQPYPSDGDPANGAPPPDPDPNRLCGALPPGAPPGFKPCNQPHTHVIVTPDHPGTGHRNRDNMIWNLDQQTQP
jgi:hypothetical protein